MNLLPQEYDWTGLDIHNAFAVQSRIRMRIETIEEAKETGSKKAVLEELAVLDLSLSQYISDEVRHQENDRTRKQIHESATRVRNPIINADEKPPAIQEDTIR